MFLLLVTHDHRPLIYNIQQEDDSFPDIVRAAGFSGTPFKGKAEESFPAWKKA